MPQSGKHAAVTELLDENVPALVLYARQWDAANAEDLVQEAFTRLLAEASLPDFPRAWLFRVVRNLAIDRSRREKKMTQKEIVGSWFEPSTNETSADDLTEALEQLPGDIREIIISKIWGNLNFREIAELTDRPISSVHYDYQQGIKQLRAFFE